MSETRFLELAGGRVRVKTAGSGPATVVIVPDPPNVIEHYDRLIELLEPELRVVCFEAPGFGFSTPARGFGFAIEEQAAVATQLLEQIDAAPAVLAFPCVSAYVALRIAERRPDLVAAIVASQAPSWQDELRWARRVDSPRVISRRVIGQAVMRLMPGRIAASWYAEALPDQDLVAAYAAPARAALKRGARFSLADAFQALLRPGAFDGAPVERPALIVWGGSDRTHSRSDPRSMREHLPDAELLEFPDCGHFPDLEQPERFASAVIALAKRCSAEGAI